MDKSPAEELKMMIGTPVYVEHDSKRVIGEVTYAKAASPERPEQKE